MTVKSMKRGVAMFLVNHILAGPRCFAAKRSLMNAAGHTLGEGTKLVGPVFCTGRLVTGKHCWLGRNLTIHGDGAVILGDNCDIAPDVTFLTGGHAIGPAERRAGAGKTEPIRVEDGCWIGARSTLLGGVTVGKGSVIGACACVTKAVPPHVLSCGVPAGTIKKLHETESNGT